MALVEERFLLRGWFLKIIRELTSDTNVFIISHKGDTLLDKFHHIIKFEKVKSFSRMAS